MMDNKLLRRQELKSFYVIINNRDGGMYWCIGRPPWSSNSQCSHGSNGFHLSTTCTGLMAPKARVPKCPNRSQQYLQVKFHPWVKLDILFHMPGKVIYTKYSKHWPYTVAHTFECVCSKMLNHGLNHGFFLSLFKLISCPIHWIVYVLAYFNFLFEF